MASETAASRARNLFDIWNPPFRRPVCRAALYFEERIFTVLSVILTFNTIINKPRVKVKKNAKL